MKKLFVVVMLALFLSVGAMAQSSYIPVKCIDAWTQDDVAVTGYGRPSAPAPNPVLSDKITPPKWIQIEVTDEPDYLTLQTLIEPWKPDIDYDIVDSDVTSEHEIYTIEVFTKPELVSATGMNRLTPDKVENFLNRWNADVIDFDAGRVRFTANIADAIMSEGFWDRPIPDGIMFEYSYSQLLGQHEIELDYSTLVIDASMLQHIIESKGCVITWHNANQQRGRFVCQTETVRQLFQQEVREAVMGLPYYSKSKFKVPPAVIQAAYDNGGSISITRAQLVNYILSRLND